MPRPPPRRRIALLVAVLLPACDAPNGDPPAGVPATGRGAYALTLGEDLVRHAAVVPPDSVLLEGIADAVDFRQREDFDRVLDAWEPGELLEHATLTQLAIDRGVFDLETLFVAGDELFEYEFRPENGLGNGLGALGESAAGAGPAPNLRRVHDGEFGGPDSFGCSTCHLKGGPDGAGNRTQNVFLRGDGHSSLSADERNPPQVIGLGPIQALAQEMSRHLQEQRDAVAAQAATQGTPAEVALETKGVSFGTLVAAPDGSFDASGVAGIDPDLVVRPFGWKGHKATLRGFARESFRINLGLISMPDQEAVRDGLLDPADYGQGEDWYDLDADGTAIEIEDGMLTTIVAYLAQLETPVIRPPTTSRLLDYFARGSGLFEDVDCATCHPPYLELIDPVIRTRPESTTYADRPAIEIDVAHDGEHPKIEPHNVIETGYNVWLYSDLKRHDMGPGLAAPSDHGQIRASVWLTRPLWGLAETAPYLHDGRAPTVDDAIRMHGGEAEAARDAYHALLEDDRKAVQIYLLSLTREPKLSVP